MQIFISYSHADSDFAAKLAAALEQMKFDVWLDRTDIQTGARWDDEIVKGLNASEIFLVLLSNKSTASQNVKDEIGYAMDHNKHILPILLETCEVPFRLRRVQYVDFTTMKFEEGLQKVKVILNSFTSNQNPEAKEQMPAPKEKPMDPATLSTTVTTLVAPFLAKLGASMMDDAIEKLPEKISNVWEVISNRFKGNPAASGAANELVKKSDDTDLQEAFALQLKIALKNDAEFASTLQAVLKEAQKEQHISNVGDGVIATNGSIGVGKIEVTGKVGGSIVIGNNNQV